MTPLNVGKTYDLSVQEFEAEQINESTGVSKLACYANSVFAVIRHTTRRQYDESRGTYLDSCKDYDEFRRSYDSYSVTRILKKNSLPPLDQEVIWSAEKVIALKVVEETGLSDRRDLRQYHFEISPASEDYELWSVLMTKR